MPKLEGDKKDTGMAAQIDSKKFNIILEEVVRRFADDHGAALKKGGVGIVGIHTRGVALARRIAAKLAKGHRLSVPVGELDITLYRDDVGEIGSQPLVKETNIPFPIEGKIILLVDDVLYTGRTIRAALDALLELGRPRAVRLAVAVDRDGRELPVQADYAGIRMSVKDREKIQLKVKEVDGEDGVWVVRSLKAKPKK
jgi:pyrimidine operon attenuation protein/uracil phosphoribosyltransferase